MKRLGEINLEIEKLKNDQRQIINIMGQSEIIKDPQNTNSILTDHIIRFAEIAADKREQWHADFEAQSPELHERFLTMIGLSKEAILAVR